MIQLCAFADESDDRLEGQIAALKRNGISLIEIRNVNGKNVMDLTDEEAKEIKARLDEEGIRVWSLGSPIGKKDITVSEEEYLSDVRRGVRLCRIFECENIRMFSFYHSHGDREKVLSLMKKTAEIGREEGIRMCHENEKGIYGDTLSGTKEILDAVPDLYSVYDPANFIQVGEKAADTLSCLADRAFYFHIKDVVSETGELVPAGYGDGDLRALVRDHIKGDKVLTVEPHLKVFRGYASQDETALKTKFRFESNEEAFDAAVQAIKAILKEAGYEEKEGEFVK